MYANKHTICGYPKRPGVIFVQIPRLGMRGSYGHSRGLGAFKERDNFLIKENSPFFLYFLFFFLLEIQPRVCKRMEKCKPKLKNESPEESPKPSWEWVQSVSHCLSCEETGS